MRKVSLIIIFIVLCHKLAYSRILVIDDNAGNVNVGKYVEYILDRNKNLNIQSVLKSASFSRYQNDYMAFQFTSSDIWLKFTILNDSSELRYLEIDQPNIDNIEFYEIEQDLVVRSKKNIGDLFPFSNREVNHRNYVFKIKKSKSPVTYIIKIVSSSHITFSMKIYSKKLYEQNNIEELIVIWAFIFLMFFFSVYFIFNYILFHDMEIIYLSIFNLLFALWGFSYYGPGFQLIWPQYPIIQYVLINALIILIPVAFYQFSRHFFNLKENSPVINIIIIIGEIIFVIPFIAVTVFKTSKLTTIGAVTSTLMSIILIIYAIRQAVKGDKSALFYLFSFCGLFISVLLSYMSIYSSLNLPVIRKWSMPIGSLWMSVFLSIGLYNKIKSLRKRFINAGRDSHMLNLIGDNESRTKLTATTKTKIKKALYYINENYLYDLSREGLAASLDISPNHLGKYFKVYTGKTINEYIKYLRIMDSAEKLRSSDENIGDISSSVGFENLRTFNRAFLEIMKITPSNYRKDYRK
ncbi:7TM-DISM domain-containing protein [Spirochaetota bacterium]